ncbi:MAG: HIT family protein [Burkholderiales bacterium]|jgi:diadenosine tetraphosphate (Ap4A) HIT family hydrolase|nr:HIT family protein [Burkholderiales bacterium]
MKHSVPDCPLCLGDSGLVVYRDARCRVVLTDEPFPGFCRVVWNKHIAEFTDLPPADRAHCMAVVAATESALRTLLAPDKMNLACLGNLTPHLHWHVIPRFADDSHFPQSVWGTRQRLGISQVLPPLFAESLEEHLVKTLCSSSAASERKLS